MEYHIDIFLTSTNYFSWKSHMVDVLRSKGFYQITLSNGQKPTNDENKLKWSDKNDEACGFIKISISLYLRFHLEEIDDPDDAWENLETMFGEHSII
jgi:hypothetical protein